MQPGLRPQAGAGQQARHSVRCWRLLIALPLLLALLGGLAGFARPAVSQEPGLLPAGPESTPFTLHDLALLRSQPAPPAISARSALVWDATAGTELFAKNPDERIPPASITKVVTALVALNILKLDTKITVDKRDISLPEYEESTMNLNAGDTLTCEDLLFGMLVVSGGDAARVTARAAGTVLLNGVTGDPIARFLQEMNSRATALGLTNTHFTNVHGDDTPDHYSTARDLLRLTVEAMKQPDFARIVAVKTTTRQTIDGKHQFPMRNTNELLFQRDGVHGVKTGTTDACGQCLVTAQWTPTGRVIAVVLGAQDRFVDTTILLDWINSAYRWVQLGPGSTLPGLQATLNRWGVAVRSQQTVVLQAWEAPSLQYRLYLDRAQGNADMPRGEIVFSTAAREVLRLPVYPAAGSATPVPKP